MAIDDNWFHRMRRGEVPQPPIDHLIGETITHVDLRAGELQATFLATDAFLNPGGTVQGGMLGAMLDALTAGLVDATLEPGQIVATSALNLAFQRPAQVGELQGRARLVQRGRTVCHVAAELHQGGKLVATASAVCQVVTPTP